MFVSWMEATPYCMGLVRSDLVIVRWTENGNEHCMMVGDAEELCKLELLQWRAVDESQIKSEE